jgi:hypothetical protein
MKINWRKKPKKNIRQRNVQIAKEYNEGIAVDSIRSKYGFKTNRQVYNILHEVEQYDLSDEGEI